MMQDSFKLYAQCSSRCDWGCIHFPFPSF